jgi:hypothetical protein
MAKKSQVKSITDSIKPSKIISPRKQTDSTINSTNIVFLLFGLQKKNLLQNEIKHSSQKVWIFALLSRIVFDRNDCIDDFNKPDRRAIYSP